MVCVWLGHFNHNSSLSFRTKFLCARQCVKNFWRGVLFPHNNIKEETARLCMGKPGAQERLNNLLKVIKWVNGQTGREQWTVFRMFALTQTLWRPAFRQKDSVQEIICIRFIGWINWLTHWTCAIKRRGLTFGSWVHSDKTDGNKKPQCKCRF